MFSKISNERLQNLIKQQNERLIANYSTDQEKVNRLQIKKKKQKQPFEGSVGRQEKNTVLKIKSGS